MSVNFSGILNKISFVKKTSFIIWLYIAITTVASIHRYLLGTDHINNFLIFKHSFIHLINNKDLYQYYPDVYSDLFKYSPTFALLMAPFTVIPDFLGIIIWNLINALTLLFAVKKLPLNEGKKRFVLLFIIIELLTSIQNSQSNALMAGLILFAFVSFEHRNVFLAALFISLSFYLKIFGLGAAILFVMYSDKIKFLLYMIFWISILFIAPLITISYEQLFFLYKQWLHLLANDTSHTLNFSVMTIISTWFNSKYRDIYIQFIGVLFLVLPLFFKGKNQLYSFRLLLLCSILIWIIIFNHKAESPTYIIAVLGISLWYATKDYQSKTDTTLLIFAFILTCLSPTDLFPRTIRQNYIVPYALKALPCILIWMKIQYELLNNKHKNHPESSLSIHAN